MHPTTVKKLLKLNHQFYQTMALQFSATRRRVQPGIQRILQRIPSEARILDLGCGNGELARAIQQQGRYASYVGLDFSAELLAEAQKRAAGPDTTFIQADLSQPNWEQRIYQANIISPGTPFDIIFAFAVLHHLPGKGLHTQVLSSVRRLLSPQGVFYHSVWQFLSSPRLRARIQPWEKINLRPEEVDPGDYLLDWRHGGAALRYVHHFSLNELETLAQETGFRIEETFFSDGENGKLGLYQSWRPHPDHG